MVPNGVQMRSSLSALRAQRSQRKTSFLAPRNNAPFVFVKVSGVGAIVIVVESSMSEE